MKRFTETEKWDDPWFRKLTPVLKCLWCYLCDRCDAAGVIELDLELAGFKIGHDFEPDDLANFAGRVEKMDGGKWRLVKFLDFQYGTLSAKCPGQTNVIKAVLKHKIDFPILHLNDRVSDRVSNTLQERKGKDRIGLEEEEARARARVNTGSEGAEEMTPADWSERIRKAYCRGDQPMDCQAVILSEIDSGTNPAEILSKVEACTAAIRKRAPGGAANQFVPRAHTFFSKRLWVDHDVFTARWEAAAKKEGGGFSPSGGKWEKPSVAVRLRTHPRLPEPPCDWRAVLRELYPAEDYPELEHDKIPWGLLQPDDRREMECECRKRGILAADWVQPPVPEE